MTTVIIFLTQFQVNRTFILTDYRKDLWVCVCFWFENRFSQMKL